LAQPTVILPEMGEWLPNKREKMRENFDIKKIIISQKENRVLGQDTEIDIFQNVTIRVPSISDSYNIMFCAMRTVEWKRDYKKIRAYHKHYKCC